MTPPEPMLSSPERRWPAGGDWVLQPKLDGFRLLVEIDRDGRMRAWSRHGTNLTERLGSLREHFTQAPTGSVFDGELVAVGQRDGRPVPDFAAVSRAVFAGDREASERLSFVAFDLLRLEEEDIRERGWRERDRLLSEALPVSRRVRLIGSQPASEQAHEQIVALGLEGTVLKRPGSIYRAGRARAWIKMKARHHTRGILVAVHQDRDGTWHGTCEIEGRRCHALVGASAHEKLGQEVGLVYSRVDADGTLREARLHR